MFLTLSDSVIEDMIKCVRNGKAIQLSLGLDPVSDWLFFDVNYHSKQCWARDAVVTIGVCSIVKLSMTIALVIVLGRVTMENRSIVKLSMELQNLPNI